ncbi:DUF4263 domain-containing protein [Phycicoccus sp. CSK15P-2]|uniref:Shedu immune nuclease family protein n=1 Tax=Phycicoccus sp. CSK15P-2 TaxID=2807627 RepID=UPI0019520B27|nr:Shedu immune nuclease family protein [Phycicoccus sp. CSK15P-2]MBM6404164.1 DUF4263 domain-containing protein [Phycicoccus sp. CSK15P-2]
MCEEGEEVEVSATSGDIDAAATSHGAGATILGLPIKQRGAVRLTGAGEHDTVAAAWTVAGTADADFLVKVLITRESRRVSEIWIQAHWQVESGTYERTVLHLSGDAAASFVALMGNQTLTSLGDEESSSFVTLPSSEALMAAYMEDSSLFEELIATDVSAKDIVAIAGRREAVDRFRRLLGDSAFFESEARRLRGGERVWQLLFEANPWMLGGGLAQQYLDGWDEKRLEQVVAGSSIAQSGKRVDALLKTAGVVRSLVFVEIKRHDTLLLDEEYRPGCWRIDKEVVGAVAQIQGTVDRAIDGIRTRFSSLDDEGWETGGFTYAVRPRSFLIFGAIERIFAR